MNLTLQKKLLDFILNVKSRSHVKINWKTKKSRNNKLDHIEAIIITYTHLMFTFCCYDEHICESEAS